ncbi:MAG TPA: DNA repair protein RecO [Anaerolineaceae bacterium]|nr:DNA repair protein RecO [Anaerolineaceae bacterium]
MPRSERSQRVEAVVLRHSDWGEADRLLVLFTREKGKIRAIAKGVRRIRSRKAGHLEPFTRSSLQLALGQDFWLVTQAETVAYYPALLEDLLRTGYAAYMIELVDRFTMEEGQNVSLYTLLVDTLQRIAEEPDPFLAVRYGELRMLELFGFRPELFNCVQCGKAIQAEDQFFSAEMGGALCPQCGPGIGEARPVSMEALKYLRHLQRSSYAAAKKAVIPAPIRNEMETLTQYDITYNLERKLNTPEFLRRVKRNGLRSE